MASVVILMGSISDEEQVAPCAEILGRLGIDFYLTVASAHRTPEQARAMRQPEAKMSSSGNKSRSGSQSRPFFSRAANASMPAR